MSKYLAERLEHCKSRPDLDQSSDHSLISTCIFLKNKPRINIKRRAWKLLDLRKLKKVEQHASILKEPHIPAEIYAYTTIIQKFLQDIINAAVPWARLSIYAKLFWTKACTKATKQTRKLQLPWSFRLVCLYEIKQQEANDNSESQEIKLLSKGQ